MIELSQQRSYNAKHFLADDGSKVLQSHAGHIHYKDGSDFKEISWDLIWNDVKRGWGFNTHSFHPFLPEYSDGLVEFRDLFQDKDQTVKYRAVCDSVKGELFATDESNPNFDNNPDNKGIIYKDAFGIDKDYLLYFTRSSLVKVATINNPNEQIADVKFKWEIQLPNKDVFRAEKKEDVEKSIRDDVFEIEKNGKVLSYKLDTTKAKTFDSAKETLIGNSSLDGKEWFTYLKSFRAWDSKGNSIIVGARIFEEDGKLYLEKTVPFDFLQKAVGRVFTDTTTSYYSSGDKCVYATSAVSWATAKGLTTGTGMRGGDDNYHHAYYSGGTYSCERTFLKFGTSALGSGASISASTVYLYGGYSSGTSLGANIYGSTAEDTITTADFDAVGSTAYCDTAIAQSSFSLSGYNSFALNATGLAAINKTGNTKISVRETNFDIGAGTPTAYVYLTSFGSETTGTSKDPYLEVTYTVADTFVPKVIFF